MNILNTLVNILLGISKKNIIFLNVVIFYFIIPDVLLKENDFLYGYLYHSLLVKIVIIKNSSSPMTCLQFVKGKIQ